MTQREFFQAVVSAEVAQELKDYATKQIEALGKKNSARNAKVREKRDTENAPLIAQIRTVLADGQAHTCAELAAYTGANSPKIAALVSKMEDVTKSTVKVDKKRAIAYTLAN